MSKRLLLAFSVCTVVAGCGGGGGGGDAPPSAAPPTVPVAPQTLGGLSDSNASLLFPAALNASSLVGSMSALLGSAIDSMRRSGTLSRELPCSDQGGVLRSSVLDNDRSSGMSGGDEVRIEFVDCPGVTGTIKIVLSEFRAIDGGGFEVARGPATVDIVTVPEIDASYQLTLSGSANEISMVVTGLAYRNASANVTYTIENGRFEHVASADETYTVVLAGRLVFSQLGGRFDYSTPAPLFGDIGGYPALGTVELRGRTNRAVLAPHRDPVALVDGRVLLSLGALPDGTLSELGPDTWAGMGFINVFGGHLIGPPDSPEDRGPNVGIVRIEPANPKTLDVLSAVGEITNPDDGDPFLVLYEWWRDGRRIWRSEQSELPAELHSKGDTIVVSVTASDGLHVERKVAGTTIVDTPLSITLPVTEYAVSAGAKLSFHPTFFDPDGDPFGPAENLLLILDYGPPGMAVDADTGLVTWTAEDPLFGPEERYRWQISTSGGDVPPISGGIVVTTDAAGAPLFRTKKPASRAGIAPVLVNSSGDAGREIWVSDGVTVHELTWAGAEYVINWALPFSLNATSPIDAIAVADSDGDAAADLFVSAGKQLGRIAGDSRTLEASTTLSETRCVDLELADLSNDGRPELICLASRLVVHDTDTLAELWSTDFDSFGSSFAVANLDTDPALEIVTANGFVFDALSRSLQWRSPLPFHRFDSGDVDGDGVRELVSLDPFEGSLRIFSVLTQELLAEYAWEPAFLGDGHVAVFDRDGDGVSEIIVVNAATETYAYDDASGAINRIDSWTLGFLDSATNVSAADLDNDGSVEIVAPINQEYLMVVQVHPVAGVQWTNRDLPDIDGPFFGGLPASSPFEPAVVMFGAADDQLGNRLLALDPATAALELSPAIGAWPGAESLAIGDYDGDGVDETFLAPSNAAHDASFIAYDGFSNTQEWSVQFADDGYAVAAAADVSGDDRADLIATTEDDRVVVYDVFLNQQLWLSEPFFAPVRPEAFDLDRDGILELIVADANGVFSYGRAADGSYTRIAGYTYGSLDNATSLAVGEVDDDRPVDIFVLGTQGTIYRFGPDLGPPSTFAAPPATRAIFVDGRGTTRNMLLAATGNTTNAPDGPLLIGISADDGVEIWRSPRLIGPLSPGNLYFFDLPTGRQAAFATSSGVYLTQ